MPSVHMNLKFANDKAMALNTYVVCVNFIHEWWDLQLKSRLRTKDFEKLFIAILFTLRTFARKKYFFSFPFASDLHV